MVADYLKLNHKVRPRIYDKILVFYVKEGEIIIDWLGLFEIEVLEIEFFGI